MAVQIYSVFCLILLDHAPSTCRQALSPPVCSPLIRPVCWLSRCNELHDFNIKADADADGEADGEADADADAGAAAVASA